MKSGIFVVTNNVKGFTETATNLLNAEAGVPGLALVHGNRGLGKTRTAKWYAAKYGATYLRAVSIWTPTWFLNELAVELGIVPKKSKQQLFTDVLNLLKVKPRLIILDEMNIPDSSCIECVRDLHDKSDNPFLLIGHEGIVERFRRFGPFFDRFLYMSEFKPLTDTDLSEYCRVCLEKPATQEAIDYVLRITGGNFRKSIIVLKGMEERCKSNKGAEITPEHGPRD